jgi:hypothetical protein
VQASPQLVVLVGSRLLLHCSCVGLQPSVIFTLALVNPPRSRFSAHAATISAPALHEAM